ncbi:hypothetical protein [Streptomyces malaysiense]|uniref:Uncharacterized protein n=1 Tax=Streptomyces malaysiense TaxID=1428626 RepID=A0A1J4Q3Q1_9ACTN|nr:hypothetical protein [Streptomyces malaysiense]OIK27642.1 hypothetical protein VT52_010140 [Streptomyces malaysiense]
MSTTELREVSSLEELQQLAELFDIVYYEVSGRRVDGFDRVDEDADEPSDDDRADIQLMQRLEGDRLAIRTRAQVVTSEGRLVADVAAVFRTPEPVSVPVAIARRFAEVIATPVTRPYLREAIHQSAVKLGIAPPLLPILDLEAIGLVPSASQVKLT